MRRVGKLLGNLLAIVILVSASWFIARPRADQPLLDALEASWPALRQAYFSPQEMEIHSDAENYVKRYAAEVVRLSALEAGSLWETSFADDEKIRKISSFQQSYNEMIKGERFVMQETRSRARERLRWPLALVLSCAGLAWLLFASKRSGWLAARLPQLMKPTDSV